MIGTIAGTHREFRLSKLDGFRANDPAVLAFTYMLRYAKAEKAAPNLRVWHHGACGRCGRELTVPGSIRRGIGPQCYGKTAKGQRATPKKSA